MIDNLFDNLDDPRRQALLMMAAGLLSPVRGKGMAGVGEAMSRGIEGGLLGFNQASNAKQSKEMRDVQKKILDAQLKGQAREQQFTDALARGIKPGVGAEPLTRVDDEGLPMPSPRPSYDFAEAMQIDPLRGAQAQKAFQDLYKPQTVKLGKDESVYSADGRLLFSNPSPIKPEKPKFVKGDIQKYASNGIEYTREFDGESWRTIAKTPQFKPESVGKPVMVEGPNGPMWVTPPLGMEPGGSVPLGIGPKMSESQKKEVQGFDAQMSIIDRALAEVKKTPSAFSFGRGVATLAGGVPESIAGRFQSPEEQQTRAFIFNVASKAINERAGAAQSAQELARLRSFLPAETDSAEQVQNKLTSFKQYLKEQRNVYSEPVRSGGASGNWGQDDLESALSKYGGSR